MKSNRLRMRIVSAPAAILSLVVLFGAAAFAAESSETLERTVIQIGEGIYVIRHEDAPDTFPQGNTTVIIGEREVLVVDSCYLPSSARADIAQIRRWTDKPVRYLVNTHWHYDHTMGNGTYWDAFSPLTIIAHVETAKQSMGYNPGWFERFPRRSESMREILRNGKDSSGKMLSEGERREYREAVAGLGPVHAEFETIVDRHPTVTFTDELTIDLGDRIVQLRHLGRGNTAGDVILFLPEERILVAGDLLVAPVPYLFGGYPVEFIETLARLARIDAQVTVPGHGNVFRGSAGRAYIEQVHDLLDAVVSLVSLETHRVGSGARYLEAVREAVKNKPEIEAWRRKFSGDNKAERDFFDTSFMALIMAAHGELSRR